MANEKRLIDANELCLSKFTRVGMSDYREGWNDALDAASRNAPIVDAVEVVRCKNCKNWNRETVSCEMNSYLAVRERPCWYEEDFCSYGERRTDD